MITHLKFMSIPVRDQERALKFYTEKLGFRVATDQAMGPGRRWIGAQRALGRRARPVEGIAVVLAALVDRVTRRLRTAGRVCRTVVLRLRFSDYTRATRSHTMPGPTASTSTILAVAQVLLTVSLPEIESRGLTLVGVALTNLSDEHALQLTLTFDRARQLDPALDGIRERFGSSAIVRGAMVGRAPGPWVPLLPD